MQSGRFHKSFAMILISSLLFSSSGYSAMGRAMTEESSKGLEILVTPMPEQKGLEAIVTPMPEQMGSEAIVTPMPEQDGQRIIALSFSGLFLSKILDWKEELWDDAGKIYAFSVRDDDRQTLTILKDEEDGASSEYESIRERIMEAADFIHNYLSYVEFVNTALADKKTYTPGEKRFVDSYIRSENPGSRLAGLKNEIRTIHNDIESISESGTHSREEIKHLVNLQENLMEMTNVLDALGWISLDFKRDEEPDLPESQDATYSSNLLFKYCKGKLEQHLNDMKQINSNMDLARLGFIDLNRDTLATELNRVVGERKQTVKDMEAAITQGEFSSAEESALTTIEGQIAEEVLSFMQNWGAGN